MSGKKDYYEILGLKKGASEADIKQAYRKLARQHHPDVAKDVNKEQAEQHFKEINEAYQVLGDPEKKKMYDQFGHNAPGAGGFGGGAGGPGGFAGGQWGPFNYSYSSGGGSGGFEDIDPFDVFESFFGGRGARTQRKGKSLYYEMSLTFIESIKGLEKSVSVESGEVSIKVPAGIQDGMQMRFAGKGMPGQNGTPAGDLYITFNVATPKQFERLGDHLGVGVEIDFVTATLGGSVEIPVVDLNNASGVGTATLKIPAGTQFGTRFRLKEKGAPIVNTKHFGDVIVQISVNVPTKLTKKQKELLEQYRDIAS
jgi:DnaJ-class molecular chaperone